MSNWLIWYSIPIAMIAMGFLLGSWARRLALRARAVAPIVVGVAAAVLITGGVIIAMEHYSNTPVDLNGHTL